MAPSPERFEAHAPTGSPALANPIEIVRYVGVDRSGWPAGNPPRDLSELYTRILVETDRPVVGGAFAASNGLRAYDRERRGALGRLFANKTVTITTLATANLNDPDLTVSLPLYSISHSSVRGTGEVFVTDFMSSHVQAPLFRIRPNTAITIHVSAKISSDLKVQGTATVLKAVQTAVSIASPTSTLLTTLSKTDLGNAATAIDSALGGLWSQDLTEDIELGRLAEGWIPGAQVTVAGKAPWGLVRTEGDDTGGGGQDKADKPIGVWRIRLACPRPSYFDPRDLCSYVEGTSGPTSFHPEGLPALKADIAGHASDASILQESLSSQVTIQDFVKTQSWYTAFLANNAKKPSDTQSFCADTLTTLYATGLSRFDASLVLRAMARQMPGIFTLSKEVAINAANCGALVDTAVILPG